MKELPKAIVIVGPTASGKTALSLLLAKKYNGEIISADSRQVYKGMNLGTGKVTKKEMARVPHHLLDIVSPKSDFNVSHFQKLAALKIKEIIRRGRVPVIVGGTGFWIDALIYDLKFPEVKPSVKLRARLEKMSIATLFKKLEKLDPRRAENIDYKNKRRLIRALEIVMITGKQVPKIGKILKYKTLILGVKIPKKELERRIYTRLIKRLKIGLVAEVKNLHKTGVSWRRLDNFGLEYRFISRYLRNLISYDEMVKQLCLAIKKYAKRQMTWFKRNSSIIWCKNQKETNKIIKNFLADA